MDHWQRPAASSVRLQGSAGQDALQQLGPARQQQRPEGHVTWHTAGKGPSTAVATLQQAPTPSGHAAGQHVLKDERGAVHGPIQASLKPAPEFGANGDWFVTTAWMQAKLQPAPELKPTLEDWLLTNQHCFGSCSRL